MIQLRGVSKTVQSGGHPLTILHPLDLDVPAGRCLAIIGPSGSGKSTLLGLIAGLDSASTGTITIAGTEITSLDEDALARLRGEKIGFVFQFFHLVPSLTAIENIQVPMEIAGRRDAAARAQALLDEVGLHDRGHHYPSQLSGGEQQRIAIARALANDPPLILADEPTGNLDSSNGRHVLDLLLQVRRTRGVTLVMVTHDPSVAAIADERLVLRDGRPVERLEHDEPRGTAAQPRTMRFVLIMAAREMRASLQAAAVLLHLHRRGRRRHRGAALGDPERARHVCRRGAIADRRRRDHHQQSAAEAGRAGADREPAEGRRGRQHALGRAGDHGAAGRSRRWPRAHGRVARGRSGVSVLRAR